MPTPLYRRNRGARGRFAQGYTANTVAGGRNPLFYYDDGETRKVTNSAGRVIEPGGRRANSIGERVVNNYIQTAAMQGARRNTAMRRRNGYRLR